MRVSLEFSNGESSTTGKPFSVTIFLLPFDSNSWSSGKYGLNFIPNLYSPTQDLMQSSYFRNLHSFLFFPHCSCDGIVEKPVNTVDGVCSNQSEASKRPEDQKGNIF